MWSDTVDGCLHRHTTDIFLIVYNGTAVIALGWKCHLHCVGFCKAAQL